MFSMRVVLVLLLALACEQSRKDAPPPRPVPADAVVDVLVDREAIAVLDRLYTYVATTARERSPVEANEQLTHGYRELIFAYGYARAGNPQRAAELVTTAKSRLDDVIDDPIHAWLVDAYLARIAGGPFPAPLDARLAQRDRMERYKIDRLREVSRVLDPDEHVDAIGAFSMKSLDVRGAAFEALRGVTDPAMRATILDTIVESIGAAAEDRRAPMLAGVLAESAHLPPPIGAGVLERALAQLAHVPEHHHGVLLAEAIVAADLVARDRVNELTSRAVRVLAEGDRYALARTLARLLRTARANKLVLGALWASAEKAGLDPQSPAHLRATFAAGLIAFDDARGPEILGELEKTLAGELSLDERLELTAALALAYAQMPAAARHAGIERLARQYPTVTDSFGTNSHFALSVLRLYDILVVGVVE